jgi:integrase
LNLTRHFYRVRERAGLPKVRFHDLRHTCLTLLLSLGTNPHVAQAIAGHSHVDVTMMTYAHTAMTEQTEALGKLGDAFGETH